MTNCIEEPSDLQRELIRADLLFAAYPSVKVADFSLHPLVAAVL